ncbi:hypothetical protein [Actinoplanes couchii]|uniref:Uncharacterized protein n=1 Tax=Actinoplanes couchii TaxID=403638 RepID=A0ABQ3XD42_9ACTN|nr:hypothetical protein [Actinoplanes couchii]MDR6321330.1 hypothetical protein [Actinoplanes couchii]GID56440.1 hypothetical protein Aco03nite_048440 [Actinoplanes couchii]
MTRNGYRFAIAYPQSWWSVNLHPSVRDAEIRKRLLHGLSGPEQAQHADAIRDAVRAARKWAAACHDQGALQFYGFFDLVDGIPLTALTMVLRYVVPEDEEVDLGDLMVGFAMHNAGTPLGKGTAANRTEILDLPNAGPAGRFTAIHEVEIEGIGTTRFSVMNTIVPLAGTREMLIVTSVTPNVDFADPFLALFEQIADTLTLERVSVDA